MSLAEFIDNNPNFKEMYDFAEVKKEILDEISKITKKYSILAFISKTCQYCQIYIPRLLKIYETVHFTLEYAIWEDYTEDESIELMDNYNLTGLPTIIIYNHEHEKKECGRVVRQPKSTLEEDILEILVEI